MEIRLKRGQPNHEIEDQASIVIYIGEDRYRISETNQGRMNINKMSDGITDHIRVHPCVANEIEIS